MATQAHTPFIPATFAELRDWVRSTARSVNGMLRGGPFPDMWNDATVDVGSAHVAGANTPTWSAFRSGLYGYAFSASALNECFIALQIGHDYARGTSLYPLIQWSANSASANTVRWGVEYSAAKGHNQGALPASTTIYIEQAHAGTAYQLMTAEASSGDAIDGETLGLEPDSLVLMRVFRDGAHANDTLAATAFAFRAGLHYQSSMLGTAQKAPDFYQ